MQGSPETQAAATTAVVPLRVAGAYLAAALLEEAELCAWCDGEGRRKLLSSSLMVRASEALAASVRW